MTTPSFPPRSSTIPHRDRAAGGREAPTFPTVVSSLLRRHQRTPPRPEEESVRCLQGCEDGEAIDRRWPTDRTISSTCAIRSATRGGSCTPSVLLCCWRKELKKLTITMVAVAMAAALDAGRGRGGGSGGVAVVDEDGSSGGGSCDERFPLTTAIFLLHIKDRR